MGRSPSRTITLFPTPVSARIAPQCLVLILHFQVSLHVKRRFCREQSLGNSDLGRGLQAAGCQVCWRASLSVDSFPERSSVPSSLRQVGISPSFSPSEAHAPQNLFPSSAHHRPYSHTHTVLVFTALHFHV